MNSSDDSFQRKLITQLKGVIANQKEKIRLLDNQVEQLELKVKCDNSDHCKHYQKLLQLQSELEFTIVDSKIKMVNMVDKVNDLEYRNDRLEGIILSSPIKFQKLLSEKGDQAVLQTQSPENRRDLILMRTLSQKLQSQIPSTVPENIISDRSNRANLLFEAIVTKLEEFIKIMENCNMESIGGNFFLLTCSLMNQLDSFNSIIQSSDFLKQKVSFLRQSGSGQLLNLIASEENDYIMQLLCKTLKKRKDGTLQNEYPIPLDQTVFHPFAFTRIKKVEVEKHFDDDKVMIAFANNDAHPSRFGRLIVRRVESTQPVVLYIRCLELFKLFNQIWRYKCKQSENSPPSFSLINIEAIDIFYSVESYVDNLKHISELPGDKLTDAAREAITYSVSGTAVSCYVMGIFPDVRRVYYDKKGNVYVMGFKTLFGIDISKLDPENADTMKFSEYDVPMFVSPHVVAYLGKSGEAELGASMIEAFMNLRKFSYTVIRIARIMFGNSFERREVHDFLMKSLKTSKRIDHALDEVRTEVSMTGLKFAKILNSFI